MDLFAGNTINWRSALMFAVCVPMVITALMLAVRQIERRANLFLAALLLAIVIVQIPQIIGFSGAYKIWPGLTFFPFDTELYLGPLLYLHAWTLIYDKPLRWRWALLIPGALQTVYYTTAFFVLGDYKAKWAYTARFHNPYVVPFETIVAIGFILWALYLVYKMTRSYDVFLTKTQSAKNQFDPIWLRQLLFTLVAAAGVYIALEVYSVILDRPSYDAAFPIQLFLAGAFAWLGMEALSRTFTAFPKHSDLDRPESASESSGRDWSADAGALKQSILNGEWFLSPTLSLRDLAQRMGSNETYMSQTINLGLQTNFNRLINEMRVEHAKHLLRSTSSSIIQIALDSGFNSKPTFNRVFRDITQTTPSQFRADNTTIKI